VHRVETSFSFGTDIFEVPIMAHQAHVDQLLHLAPGLHVVFVDVRLGLGTARGHVTLRRMKIRKRPVNKIQIKIVQAKIS